MEKKLHLSIFVLLGSFQPSVNFLTWPSSLGWGADKWLQFNSAASCTISGWTEYVLVWNVVKVTIKKLSIRIWIHIILCAQSGVVHHLVFWKEKLSIAQELFFGRYGVLPASLPRHFGGSFSFGVSCNLQDWCRERRSHATAHKREPWGAGEVKEGQMGWCSLMVPGVLPTVAWRNCSLHQFCHSWVVDFISCGMQPAK